MANDIISDVSNHVAEAQSSPEATDTVKKRGSGGSLGDKMGLEVLELTVDRAVATMPVEGNTQPMGIMHGGAYVVLGESLGSMIISEDTCMCQLGVSPYRKAASIPPRRFI